MKAPPKPPRPSSVPPTEVTVDFDVGESDTPAKNERVVQYQILCAIVDELFRTSRTGALDYIEIGRVFADATGEEREIILRVVRAVPRP